jgi:ketopantoate reductase
MRNAVIGAGAVGSYIAALLARRGDTVCFSHANGGRLRTVASIYW